MLFKSQNLIETICSVNLHFTLLFLYILLNAAKKEILFELNLNLDGFIILSSLKKQVMVLLFLLRLQSDVRPKL